MIFRVDKKESYVVLDKGFLNNKELSWQAKGLLAYMLSLPNDWRFNVTDLKNRSSNGRDATYNIIKELQKHGYVKREQNRQDGKFKQVNYAVRESPLPEKPYTDNPFTENPSLLSNKELSNKETNTVVFQRLYDRYQSKKIIQHHKPTEAMKRAVNARLKDFTEEQLVQVIDNYATVVLGDDYWFTHKYGFSDLMREKDVLKFVDAADPLNNFRRQSFGQPTQAVPQPKRITDYESLYTAGED